MRRGKQDGVQTYKCNSCGKRFRNKRKTHTKTEEHIWYDYVFKKQVLRELHEDYFLNKKTLKNYLENYKVEEKKHDPRSLFVIVDDLYFRKRKNSDTWCFVVFRDPKQKENLWWGYGQREHHSLYFEGRSVLEKLGYTILGVTGDGMSCIRKVFTDLPFQMCLVHIERIVTRKISHKPQTEAGQVLLALVKTLGHCHSSLWKERFNKYIDRYRSFLNQRTYHPLSGEKSWTHEELRSATLSLKLFEPYLFTYENNSQLSQTTNSLEGHFSHIRDIIRVHRGISNHLLQKVLSSIFLASTIAPKKKKTN